ncbi:hypothetical protein ACLOJK_034271 [Asimina triloba]
MVYVWVSLVARQVWMIVQIKVRTSADRDRSDADPERSWGDVAGFLSDTTWAVAGNAKIGEVIWTWESKGNRLALRIEARRQEDLAWSLGETLKIQILSIRIWKQATSCCIYLSLMYAWCMWDGRRLKNEHACVELSRLMWM